jgi:signal peptidase II
MVLQHPLSKDWQLIGRDFTEKWVKKLSWRSNNEKYMKIRRILNLLIPALIAVGIDRLTKNWAVATLKGQPAISYWNDFFRFVFAENEGAFLSLGSGLSDSIRYWVLAVLPILVLLYILYFSLTTHNMLLSQQIAFGLIIGGGLSNIYDRIVAGKVVDFMNIGIGGLRTGIFNVADNAIMIGLFLMLPALFWKGEKS